MSLDLSVVLWKYGTTERQRKHWSGRLLLLLLGLLLLSLRILILHAIFPHFLYTRPIPILVGPRLLRLHRALACALLFPRAVDVISTLAGRSPPTPR